jgi:GTP-binding protein
VVRRPSGDGTVFADIPGLIAGAAQGAGLGHDFLRHIERTRLLIHLVDGSVAAEADGEAEADVLADLEVVERELEAYGHALVTRPRLLVLSKCELLGATERQAALQGLQRRAAQLGPEPALAISAVTGAGLDELRAAVWRQLGLQAD